MPRLVPRGAQSRRSHEHSTVADPVAASLSHTTGPDDAFAADSFAALLEALAPASAVLSKGDDRTLERLQVVGKAFMKLDAQESIRRAGCRPTLMVYGGDLTPMLNRYRMVIKLDDDVREHRESNLACEWNLHRQCITLLYDINIQH